MARTGITPRWPTLVAMTAEAVPAAQPPLPRATRPRLATPPGQPTLSPSRAADFKTCPLLYRFRVIDRLPETPRVEQARGTLVHAVLDRLFDLPPAQRTPAAAAQLVAEEWAQLLTTHPEWASVIPETATADVLTSARTLLDSYFAVEDPRRLAPAEREYLVSAVIGDGLVLRGYIDRLDISTDGHLRVVDYKTGAAPQEPFAADALFQLKCYAVMLWRSRGTVPRVLRLVYLKDAQVRDYTPDAAELARFERTLLALWRAIEEAMRRREFRPSPGRLCRWCDHQERCPAFGGTPPPYPEAATPQQPAADSPPELS